MELLGGGGSGSDIYKVCERNEVSKDSQVETERALGCSGFKESPASNLQGQERALRSGDAGQRASCPLHGSWDR